MICQGNLLQDDTELIVDVDIWASPSGIIRMELDVPTTV